MEVGLFRNQVQHLAQAPGDHFPEQQGRHHRFERSVRVGMVDVVDFAQGRLLIGGQRPGSANCRT